ncbi:hypothetical protein ABH973_003884 [Bradyrhizobium ottawaense]
MCNPHVVETLSDQCNRRPSKVEASWGSMLCFEKRNVIFTTAGGLCTSARMLPDKRTRCQAMLLQNCTDRSLSAFLA